MTYHPLQELTLHHHSELGFEGEVAVEEIAIDDHAVLAPFMRLGSGCYDVVVKWCNNTQYGGIGPKHIAGPGCVSDRTWTETFTVCPEDYDDETFTEDPNGGGGGGNNPNPQPEPDPNTGGGSGGGTQNPQPGTPVVTAPVFTLPASNIFYRGLTDEQKEWWNANPNISNEIALYIDNQGNVSFANEILEAASDNTLINAKPFFKYPPNSNYSALYPKTTEYLKTKIPQISQNQFILSKLSEYSELTLEEVAFDLQWGNGPTIYITQLDSYGTDIYGIFDSTTPDRLYIDLDLVSLLENSSVGIEGDAIAFLLGVTVLQEYIHFGDHLDGIDQPGEEGLLFEIATYGESVWLHNSQEILIKGQYN